MFTGGIGKERGSLPAGPDARQVWKQLRSPARVLVVDEQKHCRAEIDGMLEKAEYSTVLTSDRDEAIAHLERDAPYDLVLSDLTTAGSDGHRPDGTDAPGATGYPFGAADPR